MTPRARLLVLALPLVLLGACGARSQSGGQLPEPAGDDPATRREPARPTPAPAPEPRPDPAIPEPNPAIPEPDPEPPPVPTPMPTEQQERVTCVFNGATSEQRCYSGDGLNVGCAGVGWCSLVVAGPTGAQLTWKSSCGGYAHTTLDGKDEQAPFDCAATP